MMSSVYTPGFYRAHEEGSEKAARAIVPTILDLIQPRSVVDVGCGTGIWLAVFRELGVAEILGLDGAWVGEKQLRIPRDRFIVADLTKPLPVQREFDLVVSLEVAEHLPPPHAETFVESLTRLGPVILFSAAIPFQGGTGHLNEQWPDYWADKFSRRGYLVVDAVRGRIWNVDDIPWWYAQNALLFVRRETLSKVPVLGRERDGEAPRPVAIVHPRLYLAYANPNRQSMRALVREILSELRRRINRA